MNILYLHGLESKINAEKYKYLNNKGKLYAPQIDYNNDFLFFDNLYNEYYNKNIDLIIGSSLGGYVAYWLSKLIKCDTILLNPALKKRTGKDPIINKSGTYNSFHNILLGIKDSIIKNKDTIDWLKSNEKSANYKIKFTDTGHRFRSELFKEELNELFRPSN